MALRRFAQTNAASVTASPRPSPSASPASPAALNIATPMSPPTTPRNRLSFGIHRSPTSSPSVSSSTPFDWEAVRARRPPPYASPIQEKRQRVARKSVGVATTPSKRVVRKKGLVERITSIPSRIAFEIALFPHNVPLPAPKTSAWLIGGSMHFLHLCVRISQIRKVPDSDIGWEDMYRENEDTSWFDWTVPVSFLLIAASVFNAIYIFTRVRLYRLHNRHQPVSSPNAAFVSAQLDFEPLIPPSLASRARTGIWFVFTWSWRFLLGMRPPSREPVMLAGKTARVQQLSVWNPGELELRLFSVYSPAHALLWIATTPANWMLTLMIMGVIWIQIRTIRLSFEALLKDKDIIAAEVMSEYNEGFVYPRVFPVRKDVAVMTHQSEVVNVWED